MKKSVVFFLTALLLLFPGTVLPGPGNNEAAETFLLVGGSPICLSFESYQRRDGWTPVVLSLGELDCLLWMDAQGRVSELRDTGTHFVEPVCFIDVPAHSLGKDAHTLDFEGYEQNSVRTRWRLSPVEPAGTATKKILFREGGIDLYLGDLRLRLNQAAWEFKEFSPGLFQVQFHGPMVKVHRRLVYEKAAGIIYSTHGWNNRLIPGPGRTWAMKAGGPGRQIKGGY